MLAEHVRRRSATFDELEGALPADPHSWLHPDELLQVARLHDRRRRVQWLGGRWLGKQLVQEVDPVPDLRSICIRSRDRAGRGIRPQVQVDGERRPWPLSIAHSDRAALAAVGGTPEISLGVDLVERQDLGAGFRQAWFARSERDWLSAADSLEAVTVWAFKEAIYKAVQGGEGFAPRQIEIRQLETGSYVGIYRGVPLGEICQLRSWETEGHVAALAVCFKSAPVGAESRFLAPCSLAPTGRGEGESPRLVWGSCTQSENRRNLTGQDY